MAILNPGNKVPDFSLRNEKGETVTRDGLLGSKYILFFYPKDDSPGCTKEACSIRDHYKVFENKGYKVYGVSPDTEKKHQKFIEKYEFQYSLLSDPDKKMINDFGLFGKKIFMGKEIMGVYRTTIAVDEYGMISHIIDKVNTKEHGKQLIEVLNLNG